MVDLDEMQFEIVLPDGTSAAWGHGLPLGVVDGGFDPGIADIAVQDAEVANNNSLAFGRDFFRGPTWTWELFTDTTSTLESLQAQQQLGRCWRGPVDGWQPGQRAMLRYHLGGRTRVIFGRPRNWGNTLNNRLLAGTHGIPITFRAADHLHYDDNELDVTLAMVAVDNGGFLVPFEAPIITTGTIQRSGLISVAGDVPTWPVIEIEGPIPQPRIGLGQNVLRLDMSIPEGVTVTIDTRPWERTVLRHDGASLAGALRGNMDDMRLLPGNHEFSFTGLSPGAGSPRAKVAWRAAWTTL